MNSTSEINQSTNSQKSLIKIDKLPKSGMGWEIFKEIYKKRNLDWICIKNETIAKKVGCSTRTVKRWTKKFVQWGFVVKLQHTRWSPNEYILKITSEDSPQLWGKSLDDHQIYMRRRYGKFVKKTHCYAHTRARWDWF